MVGQSHLRENSSTGIDDRKGIDYPSCVKCGHKHPRDCSVSLGQCFVCRGEGHRWSNFQYLGQGCLTMEGEVIIRRITPTGILDRYRAIGS